MTFRHRAGVSPYTSPFGLAETCVFDKQLPGPIHCGLLAQAPLIPKLRGQFAEFLNNPSPAGLRILSSSTCVGLRYGRLDNPYAFSRLITPYFPTLISVAYARDDHRPVTALLSVSILNIFGGYGISTVCASATPSGLALAPAYPGRTNLPLETSDIRPLRFSRNSRYSFRHSLLCKVHDCFRCRFTPYTTLPYPAYLLIRSLSFGCMLSPVKSSAQLHSTSELLRTL